MNYDPEVILEDHELDALAREVIATDNTTARRQYGRLVIEQTLLRIRGRTPVSRLNPTLAQARTQATNVYGSNPKLRNAFEDGARWLLDSGLVIEKDL